MKLPSGSSFAASLFLMAHSLAQASVPPVAEAVQVRELGKIRVGDSLESLPTLSRERKRFLKTDGAGAGPAFVFLRRNLPAQCMNLECGVFAREVVASGSLLLGGGSEAYFREAGLVRASDSILLVTDQDGKVTAIYRNMTPRELSSILKAHRK